MYYLYRVAVRDDTAKLVFPKQRKERGKPRVPGYPTWESATTALRAVDPTQSSRYELRDSHGYTHATYTLSRTGLPILSTGLAEPSGSLTGQAATITVNPDAERGTLIDASSKNRRFRARPLFDSSGKPIPSRARRRALRKQEQGLSPIPAVILPPKPPVREHRPEPLPTPVQHSVSIQVAPRAPLRPRVTGRHSPLARLDARPTLAPGPFTTIQRHRWEQERKTLETYDSETRRSAESRFVPIPNRRVGTQLIERNK